ncbi:hypothetical protein [Bacillus sp. 1NLA3E]|uniref:hypothetical protein n=1 Tax=Bacillus sp. 1NLA3E TaxID=666686 RepID=UPI000247E838|nr:hypothetical protein [Bacillus sp. 1NLA3E]AGK54488.1 hypothetical protein B1NLA3E_13700 [Bacillus sp. 1NLA3E]
MTFLVEYKWGILIGLEVLAWSCTFFLFYARYRLQSNFWFKVGSVLFAITGVIPQVIMGIFNFFIKGELDIFTSVIILLIIYGATIGKKQVKKLDAWAQRNFE